MTPMALKAILNEVIKNGISATIYDASGHEKTVDYTNEIEISDGNRLLTIQGDEGTTFIDTDSITKITI